MGSKPFYSNLTISKAAELSGVSESTYKKWENKGHIPVAIWNLFKIQSGSIWEGWHWDGQYLIDETGRKHHQGTFKAAWYTLKAAESKNIEFIHPSIVNHLSGEKAESANADCKISDIKQRSFNI